MNSYLESSVSCDRDHLRRCIFSTGKPSKETAWSPGKFSLITLHFLLKTYLEVSFSEGCTGSLTKQDFTKYVKAWETAHVQKCTWLNAGSGFVNVTKCAVKCYRGLPCLRTLLSSPIKRDWHFLTFEMVFVIFHLTSTLLQNAILRRHMVELTQSFMIPLVRLPIFFCANHVCDACEVQPDAKNSC